MKTYHFHHQFHSVGHGTFFTGTIVCPGDAFRWVYDCGSKASTRIRDGIERLPTEGLWPDGTTIDLVIVSHFDNDHVNGLEQFLESYRTRRLVLPYVGLKQRLAHAASLGDDDVSSAATAGLAIDPLGWLATRGLSERVDGILMVQGGRGDGALDGGDPLPETLPGGGEQADLGDQVGRDAEDPGQYRVDVGRARVGPHIRCHSHQQPVAAGRGFPMEFVFFNTALPTGFANRSKRDIGEVAREVAGILDRFAVMDPNGPKRRGWRAELRACYDRHFGRSGTERNNISLCTLARPLADAQHCDCKIIDQQAWSGAGGHRLADVEDREQALLLTGDLTLDVATMADMRLHFRDWRWRQLRVVQVPHHGSQHSWFAGNAAAFPGPVFVHCVPSDSGRSLHPHPSVQADLSTSRVLCANDDESVVQTYYIDC